jgi:hypothetical protein
MSFFVRLARPFRPPTIYRSASAVAIQATRHRCAIAFATSVIGVTTYLAITPNQIHLDSQLQPQTKRVQDVEEETLGT